MLSRIGNWISSKVSAPDPETVCVSCVAYIDNHGATRLSFRTFGRPKTKEQKWTMQCWQSELSSRRLVRVASVEEFEEALEGEAA